jgi:hypothetical protein
MLLTIIIVMLFLAAAYSTNSKRNKIYCFYRGRDKTIQARWVNLNDSYVLFPPNKKFRVDTKRMTSFWYKGGIHFLFPTKVNSLEYCWNSIYPVDPDDYRNTWLTPEAHKQMNVEEWVRSYGKGFAPQTGKKQGAIMQYLPLIAIILVIILGVYVYSNFGTISSALNELSNKINTVVK